MLLPDDLNRLKVGLLSLILSTAGCVPVPVSTVAFHPREERPFVVEIAPAENSGTFSSPVFDGGGTLLATYDSGSNLIRILRSSDLTPVNSLKPQRRPRRLSFSPSGHFLVIEAHQGWIDDFLSAKRTKDNSAPSHVALDSPEAIRDNIQRVEVWDLRTGQTTPELSCEAVVTSEPEGGWLWARQWAIVPGYRTSALLEAHFSADEAEFSVLCWNGVRQRWHSRTWERLEDLPPPPFWEAVLGLTSAAWLAAGNDIAARSVDGRIALLRIREKRFGFGTLYLWDQNTSLTRELPGECASRLQPVHALSRDGKRMVAACNQGLGYAIRAWDLDAGRELPLKDAEFGFSGGLPTLTGGGIALSPDGSSLAVALLAQMELLLPNVLLIPAGIERSDLRLWDLDQGKELVTIPIDALVGSTGYFGGVDLAFSPDSQTLAVAGRRLRIYRLRDLAVGSR